MTNATILIQNLLFKKPLIGKRKKQTDTATHEIKVLLIGTGIYAQKFIDICLTVGQIPNYDMQIIALSKSSEEDLTSYLASRPALKNFVNVNGCLDNFDGEVYAKLGTVKK